MSSSNSSSALGIKWQHLLIAAGGAAAAGAVLYYLFRNEGLSRATKKRKLPDEYTTVDVLRILSDVTTSQEKLKSILKDFTRELITRELSLKETYYRVEQMQPEDPLEKNGLTMKEFDQILEVHQDDSQVRGAIESIMGAPAPVNLPVQAHNVTRDKLIKIHEFMVDELEKLVAEFEQMDQEKFQIKTITIAAQAQVGAKVEKKFGLTSDEIEGAVLLNHKELNSDPTFGSLNLRLQVIMRRLTGESNAFL